MGKIEQQIRELHEKHMKESISLIDESINRAIGGDDRNKPHVPGNDAPAITEPSPPKEESGPDKINEIRNEVAKEQPAAPFDADQQSEFLEIVRRRVEGFEQELKRSIESEVTTIESAAQKFRDELIDYVHKQLTRNQVLQTN